MPWRSSGSELPTKVPKGDTAERLIWELIEEDCEFSLSSYGFDSASQAADVVLVAFRLPLSHMFYEEGLPELLGYLREASTDAKTAYSIRKKEHP